MLPRRRATGRRLQVLARQGVTGPERRPTLQPLFLEEMDTNTGSDYVQHICARTWCRKPQNHPSLKRQARRRGLHGACSKVRDLKVQVKRREPGTLCEGAASTCGMPPPAGLSVSGSRSGSGLDGSLQPVIASSNDGCDLCEQQLQTACRTPLAMRVRSNQATWAGGKAVARRRQCYHALQAPKRCPYRAYVSIVCLHVVSVLQSALRLVVSKPVNPETKEHCEEQ